MEKSDFTNWLLESEIPTIRYLTLRDLLERDEDDRELQAARRAVMTEGPVPIILEKQTKTGQWADEQSYYTPKYTSSHWSLMLLAELEADGHDSRFRQGADWMLNQINEEVKQNMTTSRFVLECLWGNVLRYAAHCGYAGDERVTSLSHYLAVSLDAGGCQCPNNNGLPCAWGAVRALWGLAALPTEVRSADVEAAIQKTLVFVLEQYQLVEANYPTPGNIHSLWFNLNFPLFYQVDILFVLRIARELNALQHPGARPALNWLAAQRKANGRWRGTSPYRSRTWREMGNVEETNRWVSLQAATILDSAGMN